MKQETTTDIKKISDLHLAKLQESNNKLLEIKEQVWENFQKEFELKQHKQLLDSLNLELVNERQKLVNELTNTYGQIRINPETGEINEQ